MPDAKLYVIPGSHPSRTAMLMLERKGIPYKRVDLMPVISKGILKAQRFPGITVPALKLDGSRVQGSMEIGRELDRIQPEPALYPADPDLRAKVEEAEAWGDEFQQKPRRLSWWAFKQNRPPMASYSEGGAPRCARRVRRQDGRTARSGRGAPERFDRCERERRSVLVARGPRPNRRLDRGRGARRTPAQRGRLPDRP